MGLIVVSLIFQSKFKTYLLQIYYAFENITLIVDLNKISLCLLRQCIFNGLLKSFEKPVPKKATAKF